MWTHPVSCIAYEVLNYPFSSDICSKEVVSGQGRCVILPNLVRCGQEHESYGPI